MLRHLTALSIATACLLTAAAIRPAMAGPPFITDDPEPVDLGHWEVYGFSAGATGLAIPPGSVPAWK